MIGFFLNDWGGGGKRRKDWTHGTAGTSLGQTRVAGWVSSGELLLRAGLRAAGAEGRCAWVAALSVSLAIP